MEAATHDSCVYTQNVCLDKDGYPRAKYQGKVQGMHRIIYRLINGEGSIPEGGVIGHRCNNKGCVNPKHLYLTTAAENSTHAARDNLYRTGESSGRARLTDAQVKEIIDMYRTGLYSQDYISEQYNCSQSQVSSFVTGKRRNKTGEFIKGDNR